MNQNQLEIHKKAKGSPYYEGWKPYCLKCNSMARMKEESYGFSCSGCQNTIGFDLNHYFLNK